MYTYTTYTKFIKLNATNLAFSYCFFRNENEEEQSSRRFVLGTGN